MDTTTKTIALEQAEAMVTEAYAPVAGRLAPVVSPTAQVLITAAWLLQERGWCQWRSRDPNGALCLYAAIRMSTHDEYLQYLALTEITRELSLKNGLSVIDWNDTPGRTLPEVLSVLERVAARVSD